MLLSTNFKVLCGRAVRHFLVRNFVFRCGEYVFTYFQAQHSIFPFWNSDLFIQYTSINVRFNQTDFISKHPCRFNYNFLKIEKFFQYWKKIYIYFNSNFKKKRLSKRYFYQSHKLKINIPTNPHTRCRFPHIHTRLQTRSSFENTLNMYTYTTDTNTF